MRSMAEQGSSVGWISVMASSRTSFWMQPLAELHGDDFLDFMDLKEALCSVTGLQSSDVSFPLTIHKDTSHKRFHRALLHREGEEPRLAAVSSSPAVLLLSLRRSLWMKKIYIPLCFSQKTHDSGREISEGTADRACTCTTDSKALLG
ncbi:unnamed protein product [Pleuronectes platessa]|uniref:Uncharacterized protein n=1 Tax=Pleuronectes platessa TaxID=8262 RepID=A0A9N7UP11_PLEPL|nr:unnamed protein product [Pleuronectes platessa]